MSIIPSLILDKNLDETRFGLIAVEIEIVIENELP